MSQLKGRKKEQILSYFVFGFIQAFSGLDGATHEGGKSVLPCTLTQMIVSSRNILTDTPWMRFNYLGTLWPSQVDVQT